MQPIKLRHSFYKSERFKAAASELDAWDYVDKLKMDLDRSPESGDVIPGGDGLRKIRMGLSGRGKRSGARVIYFQIVDEQIFLIEIYAKNEKEDLTQDELKLMIKVRDNMIAKHRGNLHEKKPSCDAER